MGGFTMQYTITRENATTLCTVEQVMEFDEGLGWYISVVVRVDGHDDIIFTDYNGAMSYVAHFMEVD